MAKRAALHHTYLPNVKTPQFMLKFVRPYCTGVSATFAHQNHHLASEILKNFRGQDVASHWIEASYVVISAALACHKHAGTIEANRLIGQTLTEAEGGDVSS